MPEPLLLFDTDIFIILSAPGLLENVITMLGFDVAHTRRLPALERQLRAGAWFKKRLPDAIREAALPLAQRISGLGEKPHDPTLRDRLIACEGIDDGEALLFALLAEQKKWMLATGDKKAIIALATTPALQDVRDLIRGRIICLETIILALISKHGIASVASGFAPLREQHATLRFVFPKGELTKESVCRKEIAFYLNQLEKKVGTDFLRKP
jgi:hypothetical protein